MLAVLVASVLILSPPLAAATHVTPTSVPDNPNCIGLNSSWTELKDETLVDGMYTEGVLSVTLDYIGSGPDSVDWTATLGIDAVIVKGANNANLYTYDPPTEALADTGLVTPTGQGISHVSFCFDEDIIGGTGIHIDKTALLLAGPYSFGAWLIPVIVSAIGIGIFVVSYKKNNQN